MLVLYCYESSDILRNKWGLKDNTKLKGVEVLCNMIHKLFYLPLDGNYNFEHFCRFYNDILKE